ncbi:MAG TPA: efflux RND transporter periplasmic adaptor subunit [Phycisphaerales bacterium]|nr:efflux RND transporter periplasmic adaptor subunit [Phycisphaerales bacterium]HMP37577.1 efflux RND transporter periplasmic adaptor subunit [Phycisphaerales bacterium]
MRTILTILLTAIVLVMAAAIVVGPRAGAVFEALGRVPSATQVRAHEVAIGTIIEVVSAPGVIEPFRKVDVSAEISARIDELPFREGDAVQSGDVIVRLDDRDLRAALASVTARRDAERFRLQSEQQRLAGPRATLTLAQRTLERQEALLATGDVSQQAVDEAIQRVRDLEASIASAERTISVLESSLAAAEAEISRAEEAVRRTVITSPIEGVITQLNAEVGELVLVGTMNNPGTVIMTVADLSRMILNAEVAETDIARLRTGQQARIHVNAYPDFAFDGSVSRIGLQRTVALGQNPYFKVEIDIDLDGRRILSGLAANVDVRIAEHEGLVLPSQAVLQRPVDELPAHARSSPAIEAERRVTPVVYRIVAGRAVATPVRLGPSDLASSLVRQGLGAGDVVVVGPFKVLEKLVDGDAIRRDDDLGAADGSPRADPPRGAGD